MSLPQAIESEPELRHLIAENLDIQRLTDMGMKLEGLYRHASTHAAGVVISDRPLKEPERSISEVLKHTLDLLPLEEAEFIDKTMALLSEESASNTEH